MKAKEARTAVLQMRHRIEALRDRGEVDVEVRTALATLEDLQRELFWIRKVR